MDVGGLYSAPVRRHPGIETQPQSLDLRGLAREAVHTLQTPEVRAQPLLDDVRTPTAERGLSDCQRIVDLDAINPQPSRL